MPRTPAKHAILTAAEADIEILDDGEKPLLIMPQTQVLRQKLRHRAVLVGLRNAQGHIYLYKKTAANAREAYEEAWFPAAYGRVVAGESRYEAGMRLLGRIYGVFGVELFEAARFRQPVARSDGNAVTTLFLTAKTSIIPKPREEEASDGIFVDKEEFLAIMRDCPHMVTPVWELALPYLF